MKLSFLIAFGNCFQPQSRRNTFPFLNGEPWETFDDLKEILAADNGTLFKEFLEHAEKDDFVEDYADETCELGENVPNLGDPEFTDGVYKCLMLQKCYIRDRKFEKLQEYYDQNGITDSPCLAQLEQFNDDLVNGEYHAQQMCDSWGEDIDFRNWPGLQFQISATQSGAPFYWRETKPGLINQCRKVHRRDDNTGETLYEGQYVLTRPLVHGIKYNGWSEIKDNYANCMAWCSETDEYSEEQCPSLCMAGSGFKLFDFYFTRGVCYPDTCTAPEILILQSNVPNVTNIIDYVTKSNNGQKWTEKAIATTLRMQIEKFTPIMDRVHKPTLIGYCCFMGFMILAILMASIMLRNGSKNLFTDIFAYQNHWAKLLNMKRPSKAVKSIDGVRAISMSWVMIAHLYTQLAVLGDSRNVVDALKNGEMGFITGGTPSVDSFFCIGGLLLAYLYTDTIIKTFNSAKSFTINWFLYMTNRWMRITPMVMIIAWTIVSILPLLPNGYNYPLAESTQKGCGKNLWFSFFYLDGWIHGTDAAEGFGFCNGVTWYLSCDFFYFALFPFMAVLYGWHKMAGILGVTFCICGSMAHNMYSSFVSESYILQTYRILTQWPNDRELDPYMPPWARYHSHGVGVLFGWLLLSERKNQVISKFLRKRRALIRVALILATWVVTLGTFWFIVFGLNYCFKVNWVEEGNFLAPIDFNSTEIIESFEGCMTKNGKMDWTAVSIWNGSFRALWSAALSIMIILCDMKYGFLINWFLSCKPLLLMSKLSFGMYLLHYNIYAVFIGSVKHVVLADNYELFWDICGMTMVTAILALFFHLVIEAPMATIWGLVMKLIKPKPKPKQEPQVEVGIENVAEKTEEKETVNEKQL